MFNYSSVNDGLVESESRGGEENEDPEDPDDTEGRRSRLWVDRFSPRHYTELLSDDVSRVSVQQIMSVFVRKTKSALLRINPSLFLDTA